MKHERNCLLDKGCGLVFCRDFHPGSNIQLCQDVG